MQVQSTFTTTQATTEGSQDPRSTAALHTFRSRGEGRFISRPMRWTVGAVAAVALVATVATLQLDDANSNPPTSGIESAEQVSGSVAGSYDVVEANRLAVLRDLSGGSVAGSYDVVEANRLAVLRDLSGGSVAGSYDVVEANRLAVLRDLVAGRQDEQSVGR